MTHLPTPCSGPNVSSDPVGNPDTDSLMSGSPDSMPSTSDGRPRTGYRFVLADTANSPSVRTRAAVALLDIGRRRFESDAFEVRLEQLDRAMPSTRIRVSSLRHSKTEVSVTRSNLTSMVGPRQRGRVVTLVAATALVVSACANGSVDPAGAEPSQEPETYLKAVAEISSDFDAVVASIDERMQQVYATREALLTAVADAGISGASQSALAKAEALTPTDEFETDHQAWIGHRVTIVDLAAELDVALENQDLQEALAVNGAMLRSRSSILLTTTREFCLAFAESDSGDLCVAGDGLPGGQYGLDAYEALRRYTLDTLGLFSFPLDLSPEERAVRLNEVQPSIERALKDTGEKMAELDPPSEFADDHAAFVRFFDEQHQTAVAITAANAERDNTEVLRLFDESGVVGDRLTDSLSQEYEPIAAPFFPPD